MSAASAIVRAVREPGTAGALWRAVQAMLLARDERALAQRNALVAFAIRVASAAILFLSQVAIARWMGGHEFGLYVYAWTWVLVLGGLATLGFNVAMIRLVPEYRTTGRLDDLRGLLRGGRWLVLASATLIAALVAATLLAWGAGLPAGQLTPILIALLAAPPYALTDAQDGICRGSARILSAIFAPYILRPLLILAGIAILLACGAEMAATSAAIAAVAATWIAWAAQTFVVHRLIVRPVSEGARRYEPRKWLATSLPLLAICACELALQNTDVIVIANALSPTEAGIYFAAAKTMGLIMFVYYAVGSAMANRFAAASARNDDAELRAHVREAVRWTFWPSLALGLVMLAAGRPLLGLFGAQFAEGYPVMCVLILAFLARAAIGPVDFLLNMTGGQADCARALTIAALLNLVLDLVLVPRFGIMGAASAVSLSLVAGAILNYRVACRRLGFDIGIWARGT